MTKPIAEVRRPEIIEGALRAIAKNGLPSLSYDLIAGEAEMSRQLIRHYFPSPEAMMVSVCDRLAARYRELLSQGILETRRAQRLDLFLDFFFGVLDGLEKPADEPVYDALLSLATGSDKIRTALHDQFQLLQEVVAMELQVSRPQLDQPACTEIAHLFVSLLYGHWTMVGSLGFSSEMNRTAREAITRLIDSYVAQRAPATTDGQTAEDAGALSH
ncbi:TetR/AcrR family transcriptional regulator [Pseudoroseicyclus aestuarii]|uniref:TetR family transcriptional regulator n=1 Tax=Pseudoroseicyclus aestuarii TaxID=1795041 RepID=A0A318SWI1_9RHOB|nr:TetR family transcriptional regulator [Pseudoroseicyclus aestuarii]PYE84736.1 TetR family transcriptional regulator [Pseudoroseicyclus aestuarii]